MPVALLVTLIAIPIVGCESEAPPPVPERIRPVRYAEVQVADQALVRSFSGAARADVEAELSFRVGGTVQQREVEVGMQVTGGALLASLDARDFNVAVSEAEAQLSNAEAMKRNTQANYDRVRGLYENDNVALSELDSARAAAESAAAQVQIAEQNLANRRLQLSYTRLYAPAACGVAETFVKENENVQAGQPIVRLNCGDCPEVHVSVPETQIHGVGVGDAVAVTFAALPGERFPATVTEVGVAMTSSASAFPVVAKLTEHCGRVRPGMAADVAFSFDSGGQAGGVIVPTVAVGEDRIGRYVFVLEARDEARYTARRRAVETGQPTVLGIPVLSGLEAGERVVTAGVRRITDGMTVRLYHGED